MLERNAANLDVATIMAATANDHPRDAVPAIMHALLDANDHDLEDDATALCLDRHGGGERQRTTSC